MATNGNNINPEHAYLRDCFINEDMQEDLNKLMQDPKNQIIHRILTKRKTSLLYEKAMELIEKVDNGEFTDDQMDQIEKEIAFFLSAIEDITMSKEHEHNTNHKNDDFVR